MNPTEKNDSCNLSISAARKQLIKNKSTQTEVLNYEYECGLEFNKKAFDRYGNKICTSNIDFFTPGNISAKQDRDIFVKSFVLNPLKSVSVREDPIHVKLHLWIENTNPGNKDGLWMEDIPEEDVQTRFRENIYELIRFCNLMESCKREGIKSDEYILLNNINDFNFCRANVQNQYFKLSREKSLPEMAALGEFSESAIREILGDYDVKYKNRILNNFGVLKDYIEKTSPFEKDYSEVNAYMILKKITTGLENDLDVEKLLHSIVLVLDQPLRCTYN